MISPSSGRLAEEIRGLLEALRGLGGGSFACLVELRRGLLVQTPPPEDARLTALGHLLEQRREALFALPAAMEGEGPAEDLFAGWEEEGFLLAVLNQRVALVVACPDPEGLRARADEALRALVDRLLRFEPGWRIDPQGRGVFLGRPRLEVVVVSGGGSGTA